MAQPETQTDSDRIVATQPSLFDGMPERVLKLDENNDLVWTAAPETVPVNGEARS